ncbi:MAG TPA: type II secretion system F family protein [Vicinamibacterales bacterium]|jgi:tight adherence protein B|nr:type II secretion system F family protein [Vicinamibacterales bacterium]
MLIVTATFVLCTSIILGIYWVFVVRPEDRADRALHRRLRADPADRPARGPLARQDVKLSALWILDAALARSGRLTAPLKRSIANSGLRVTIGAVLLASGFLATTTFSVLNLVTSAPWLSVLAAAGAASLPYWYVRRVATKRLKKFEEQLPQAVEMIAVSLRAGHALTTGLLMVAEELENPLGGEFRLLYDQQTYGKPIPDVLREFADRVPLLDARILVMAVLTQRETGGNLAEILDKLAAVIRERFHVRRQVRVVSAHGRITGWVLALVPPVLAAVLLVIAPNHIRILVDDPLGRQMVAAAVGLQVVGTLAIRRIVRVEF